MYVTDRHDVTLAVKVALNPNTINFLENKEIFVRNVLFSIWKETQELAFTNHL